MPGPLQGGRCKWSSHSCIQALTHRRSVPAGWVKLLVYHCFCWTLIALLPSFLSVLSCARCLPFFLINPRLYLLSASLFSYTFTLANTLTSKDSTTLYLKVCTTPSVLCTLPLVSHPQRVSITSSHSEAKEGMRSMDGCPDLQLDTDPLRPARPPSSSPSGDANKSESDLDRLRVRPRSAGLALKAATGAETSLEPLASASGLWSTSAELASGAQSAIVVELPSAARAPQFGVQQSDFYSAQTVIHELCWRIQLQDVQILQVVMLRDTDEWDTSTEDLRNVACAPSESNSSKVLLFGGNGSIEWEACCARKQS